MSVNNSRGAKGDGPPDRSLLLLIGLIGPDVVNQFHSLYIYLELRCLDGAAASNTTRGLAETTHEKWKSGF